MLFRDHKNRLYKTGLKIDYTPKMIVMNKDFITPEKVRLMACGRRHYTILDTDNNIHCIGGVMNKKSIG
jgi:alpha-tubulin suppressor-like RCC1 family protein